MATISPTRGICGDRARCASLCAPDIAGRDSQSGAGASMGPAKFGRACPQYLSSEHSVAHFASKTHAVGVRLLDDGRLQLTAPFGLNDIFSFRLTPNRVLDNRTTHQAKGLRAVTTWPEVTVEPW
ncbi:nucleotidyltransferase family protein [Neoaquamicrobium sediminum]|uniref:nucleotidyltransferase family protein n=1 Tax=Neoaquamicrobium sediminum TaxID=1849104 RepID=UPI0028A58E3A|nr:nucleotidyltransferase family protein [Mesorhizobium sediminum]